MMYRKGFFLLIVILTAFSVASAHAQTVFGPQQFSTDRWHSHLSRHVFRADAPGEGTLVVHLNTPTKKIYGGLLVFNRRLIPLCTLFGQTERTLRVDRFLRHRNRLAVVLLGAPGASVTVEVRQKENPVPPSQVGLVAVPAAIHAGESSELRWTTTDADTVSIDHGIGMMAPDGSETVSPVETTIYTLTATNAAGTTTAQATVTHLNSPPTAMDDHFTTDENTPITITNFLANDTDLDGDELSITDYTQPANGKLVDHGNGSFTYTPTVGFSGTNNFAYTCRDGHGGADTGRVTIHVMPVPLALQITDPPQEARLTGTRTSVSGTINKADASVFVNGVAATVTNDQFSAPEVILMPGANTINALAKDDVDTVVDSVTVWCTTAVDLEPVNIELITDSEADESLKVCGQALVTVANHGSSDLAASYQVVLFEDSDVNGSYDQAVDNRLGQATVTAGPAAGQTMNVAIDFAGELLFRDNRLHCLIDSDNQVEESDEANNMAATQAPGLDLSASRLSLDDVACPDDLTLSVRIGNTGNGMLSRGIPVAFYDGEPGNDGRLIATVETTRDLAPGQYADLSVHWSEPLETARTVYARADDDGTGNGTVDEIDNGNNQVILETAICPPEPPLNGISGRVVDAVSGMPLIGASVSLDAGAPGSPIDQTTTGNDGRFTFENIDLNATILMAAMPGYITGERRVVRVSGTPLHHQDLVLSPVLDPEAVRIVLTWGEHPADLEAHLTAPNPQGCRQHCYYWNPTIPGADLDLDDRESYGPETMTIFEMEAGTYRFYVHDFSNRYDQKGTALAESGARVTVYADGVATPWTFEVPAGIGTVWHVFNLDGTSGTMTPIGKLTHQNQPGQIDFPVITSSPPTRATFGELYQYQVEAIDPDLDNLTYRLISGPEGMSLDPFSGLIQWTPTAGQGGLHRVEIRAADGRCGEDIQHINIVTDYHPLADFSVEPCSGVNPGGDIVLSWDTERAERVVIDQGIGAVAAKGSLTLPSPEQPTPFALRASNGAGEVRRVVPQRPMITSFSSSCVEAFGETSTLTWASSCATDCSVNQGIGRVDANGLMEVTPTELPQKLSLTCVNGAGIASDDIVVNPCLATADIMSSVDCNWLPGDPLTLDWTTSKVGDCTILPDVGSVPVYGSVEVWPTDLPAVYTLACTGASDTVYIDNPREFDLAAESTALLPGESTSIYWRTQCYDACRLDQGIGDVPTTGRLTVTPEQLPTTYTLTATDSHASVTRSVTIGHRKPAITFGASPAQIKNGDAAILTWTTDRATACTIQPDVGPVATSGSLSVSPNKNTTYRLTATGPGGTTRQTAGVTYLRPTASIHADPQHLLAVGDGTLLTWVFSNAETCTIEPDIGEVALGGSMVVHPQKTTIYTITAAGCGGVATDQVKVAFTPPTVQINADRLVLDEGQTATLTWNFSDADSASIDQGIGKVESGSSLVVNPGRTTTYTITAEGPGGRVTDRITLTCLVPTAMIQTVSDSIIEGESTVLSWQAEYAATRIIEPDIGPVAADGSIAVSPAITTVYTLTASGRGGTASTTVTVDVINPPSITLIEPDGHQDTAHTGFTIRWHDTDHDSDARISLFYDINDSGEDGTLIASGISEDPDGLLADGYIWDTRGMTTGSYFVYARIEDGINAPRVDYSDGVIDIDHEVSDQNKLSPGDGAAYHYFGSAVAIDGEYAVVGAPGSDAAYVFQRDGAAWAEQFKLRPGDGHAEDGFGSWVAMDADTIVVGAPNHDAGAGAAYVFSRDGTTWIQTAKLAGDNRQTGDHFGACLDIDSDTIVVGAAEEDASSGAAYVFIHQGSTWIKQVRLTAGNAAADGRFGASVSIDASRIVVGSPAADAQNGAAHVFERDGVDWTTTARLVPGDGVEGGQFGHSVCIDANHMIVGNVDNWEAGVDGTVYIFNHDGATWSEQTIIRAPDVNAGESFGQRVTIHGDTAAVGQPKVWNAAGAVYLFTHTGDTGLKSVPVEGENEGEGDPIPSSAFQKLTPRDGEADDYFGASLDLDDDNIIVGAWLDDDKGYNAGSAYVFPLFSVSIDADPATLHQGGEGTPTTTLSWTSRGADSLHIDPEIGNVSPSGSRAISLHETTTYTITGTRNGATVTDRVTISVIDPSVVPSVEISATQTTSTRGDPVTLSWSATNVDTVTLNHAIGEVPMTGNLIVFPIESTTYTVTADNAAGTATASVAIQVIDPLPMITLSVIPEQITAGEPATLSWTSTHADTVSIEPGIGAVQANGTLAVTPMQTTTYTITASGSGGTATASVTVNVDSPISIQIISPVNGESIDRPSVMVYGTFSNATDSDTGVAVNGKVAMVHDNQFAINGVSLEEGENLIVVRATDTEGNLAQQSITIYSQITENLITLSAGAETGIEGMQTILLVSRPLDYLTPTITYNGPDGVSFLPRPEDKEYPVTLSKLGIYEFTATVTDDQGFTHSDTLSIMVLSADELDKVLKTKWNDLKAALASGDIEAALQHHYSRYHKKYRAIYNALGDDLPTLVGQMQDISWICYVDGRAKYRIRQDHLINGQIVAITYYVYFIRGENGLWQIERY